MTIKNLINPSSIPEVSTLSINLTFQTTSFSLSFVLNMKIDFLKIFCPYTHPHQFRFNYNSFVWRNFGDFFYFRFNQKIRVWGYFNWGRTLPLIIGRIFGNFGLWIKDCKIRVPILYIWGRNRFWGRETLGKMTFLHFMQISQISPYVGYNRPY